MGVLSTYFSELAVYDFAAAKIGRWVGVLVQRAGFLGLFWGIKQTSWFNMMWNPYLGGVRMAVSRAFRTLPRHKTRSCSNTVWNPYLGSVRMAASLVRTVVIIFTEVESLLKTSIFGTIEVLMGGKKYPSIAWRRKTG